MPAAPTDPLDPLEARELLLPFMGFIPETKYLHCHNVHQKFFAEVPFEAQDTTPPVGENFGSNALLSSLLALRGMCQRLSITPAMFMELRNN